MSKYLVIFCPEYAGLLIISWLKHTNAKTYLFQKDNINIFFNPLTTS